MNFNKIIQLVKESQPLAKAEIIEQAHAFLENQLEALSFADKRTGYNAAIEKALEAAENRAEVEFISACLLFDLTRLNQNIDKEISRVLGNDIGLIVKSHEYARRKLIRAGKEAHFAHAYETAGLAAKVKVGTHTICAALLHDLPYQAAISIQDLSGEFDKEIGDIVDNFQKIRSIKTSNNKQFASHLREMVVALSRDLRAVIIKMCSNVDYLKNYQGQDEQTLRDLAAESMEILSPIADLLGIWHLRWQLEDHAFRILQPEEYEKIARRFNVDEKKNREKYIQKTANLVAKAAHEADIPCKIEGRFKHFYSIFNKMQQKKKEFNDICDVFALRVIVDSVDECYRMLGIIHRLWRPVPHRVKDYIAAPKTNHYRSLHTTVYGINNRPTEFQIRTKEINEEAQFGIAAHWYYKLSMRKTPAWIQELLVGHRQYGDDKEFLKQFSSEFLKNRIYVYTPKGDVISLPAGSTPVDFAYHIHTELGNKIIGAKVNEQRVTLGHQLATNDIVEIMTDRQQSGPKSEWLGFVKTDAAKKHIENYFQKNPVERSFRL